METTLPDHSLAHKTASYLDLSGNNQWLMFYLWKSNNVVQSRDVSNSLICVLSPPQYAVRATGDVG